MLIHQQCLMLLPHTQINRFSFTITIDSLIVIPCKVESLLSAIAMYILSSTQSYLTNYVATHSPCYKIQITIYFAVYSISCQSLSHVCHHHPIHCYCHNKPEEES